MVSNEPNRPSLNVKQFWQNGLDPIFGLGERSERRHKPSGGYGGCGLGERSERRHKPSGGYGGC